MYGLIAMEVAAVDTVTRYVDICLLKPLYEAVDPSVLLSVRDVSNSYTLSLDEVTLCDAYGPV